MACEYIEVHGHRAIICGLPKRKRCSSCGAPADRMCDWKIGATRRGKRKDCDAPICARCSTMPAPDKDLCREHATAWGERICNASGLPYAQGDTCAT